MMKRIAGMGAFLCLCCAAAFAGTNPEDLLKRDATPLDVWSHVGETSAVLSCVTKLPAHAVVEYGPTNAYGKVAKDDDSSRNVHVIRITGLEPGKECHARFVMIAGDDKTAQPVRSEDIVLKPARIEGAIHLEEQEGPPYMLDKAGATYVLGKDVTADGTAIYVKASNVTLELDGHRVGYGRDLKFKEPKESWLKSGHGIMFPTYGVKDAKVFNGTIEEATPKEETDAQGFGHNPINGNGVIAAEFAGLTVKYSGKDIRGVWINNSSATHVHHCIIDDEGTHVTNRHQGVDALIAIGKSEYDHNLIKRVRQRGMCAGSDAKLHHNEIHVDSWATNSYDIMCYKTTNAEVYNNFLYGTGYHVIGVGTVSNSQGCRVHDNWIELTGHKPEARWAEYGEIAGMNGCRVTWGGKDLEYWNNVFIITGDGGSSMRGTWFCSEEGLEGVSFHDNYLKVLALDEKSEARACACDGDWQKPDHAPIVYRNNVIVSNTTNVRCGEAYGLGSNHTFIGCTFKRDGNDPRYKTVTVGYWDKPCRGHRFIDCKFEDGASFDAFAFEANGDRSYTVEWTVTVKTAANAEVTITDKDGKEAFKGTADAQGLVNAALAEYKATPGGKDARSPYTVTVKSDGKEGKATVTADSAKTVTVGVK